MAAKKKAKGTERQMGDVAATHTEPSHGGISQIRTEHTPVARLHSVDTIPYAIGCCDETAAACQEIASGGPVIPLVRARPVRYSNCSKPAGPLPKGTLTSAGFSLRGGWR
jgi:hypothetical protein